MNNYLKLKAILKFECQKESILFIFNNYLFKEYVKNIEKQIEEQKEGLSLLSVKNIGGDGIKFFQDLTSLGPQKKEEED